MMPSPSILSLKKRVYHQLAHEWRHQRWLVLFEWALLGFACLESLRHKPEAAILPVGAPALVALLIIGRSVRADAPRNAEVASHTRPAGRHAVWAGKVVFFGLVLLLPWVAHGLPQFFHYGFGAREWLGLLLEGFLPAALLGALVAALFSQAGSTRQNVALTAVALLMAWGLSWVLARTGWSGPRRCGTCIGGLVLIAASMLTWWHCSRLRVRSGWICLALGMTVAIPLPFVWPWDWRVLPPQKYAASTLSLHIGGTPTGTAQELWPGLHVLGLAKDEVASVVALAPTPKPGKKWPPQDTISSDFTNVNSATRKGDSVWRWIREEHVACVSRHYPPDLLWKALISESVRGPAMQRLIDYTIKGDPDAMQRPWRLRLAVHRMQRVYSQTLKSSVASPQTATLELGHRLDFRLQKLDHPENGGQTRFSATLRRRFPLLVPEGTFANFRPLGYLPLQNFLAVLTTPSIGEAQTAGEAPEQFNYRGSMFLARHDRDAHFAFAHPRPHMDIAGLTLAQWINDSTLDIWWPEQRGTLDLEISSAEMQRLLAQPQSER